MDSQDSLSLGDDFSLLAAQGLRQSMDNQTLAAPPAPLAASTVLRTQYKSKDTTVDPRSSFLTSESSPRGIPRDVGIGQMKLSFGGLDQSTQNDMEALTKQSVNLIEFSKTGTVVDRDDDSDENGCNLSARSSLGILPVEALNDLSASLLPVSSGHNNHGKSLSQSQPSSFKDSVDSGDWRDYSKQDSKDQPIGISHVVDTVKKRPGLDNSAPQRGGGGTNMCLFGGSGPLTDVAETSELEQSVVDVQFEDEELKMLDEDFSDIEVSDLSDEDNETKKQSGFVGTDLSDFLELERKLNEESRSLEDEEEEHGQGEGQESEEDESPVSTAAKNSQDLSAGGLDMKYFRPSPLPAPQVGESLRNDSSLNLSELRRQFCTGNGSEIDTEDELEAARQTLAQGDNEGSSGRQTPRPGLVGQQTDRAQFSMLLRQSAEGDVVTSPVPGDGGGGGDGSSGSETDGQGGGQQGRSQPHRFAQGQTFPEDYDVDTMPEEQRVRPMGDDLLSRDAFASMNGDNNSVAGIDRFAAMDDGQNFMGSTMRTDVEDSRLQSRFLAPVGQSLNFGDSVSQLVPQSNTSSFNIEDMFLPGQQNTSQDSGINTAANQGQGHGPRLDASGFNADDVHEVKDPFGAFDSSFGSFGLNNPHNTTGMLSPPDLQEKHDHLSLASSGLGQSFETAAMDRQSGVSVSGASHEPVQQAKDRTVSSDKTMMTKDPVSAQSKGASSMMAVAPVNQKQPPKPDLNVYYDVSGEGVTDLAFHKSLMKEASEQKQILKADDVPVDVLDKEQFFQTDNGKAMLDADEQEFEKENIFMQDDKMSQAQYRDVISNSVSCWDSFNSDAFMRISIGQYLSTRTEVLGTLEGDPMRPRPEFGMLVRTPPGNRKPVALISASPKQNSDMRTAGVGNEDEGERTLLKDRDSTFTIDEMAEAYSNQSPPRSEFKKPLPFSDYTHTEKVSDHSGNSSESDHSQTDISKLLTVSAIDSFIGKVAAQSNPGELVSTIMKVSSKHRNKDKRASAAAREKSDQRQEVEDLERKIADQERRRRLDDLTGGHRESPIPEVFNEKKSKEESTLSPSKKPLRGSRLPIRKGSLASTYEKAWKERQNADKPKQEEKAKVPRRRSDIVVRPKPEMIDKKPEEFEKPSQVQKMRTASAGLRKCKSSSCVSEKFNNGSAKPAPPSRREPLKADASAHIRQNISKQNPPNTVSEKDREVNVNQVTPEKKLNRSVEELKSPLNDSTEGGEWLLPRPSLGGDFLEEQLASQDKGNTQQNLMASYDNVQKLGQKENMTDLSKIYCDKGRGESNVDIAGLRQAIMDERRKGIENVNRKQAEEDYALKHRQMKNENSENQKPLPANTYDSYSSLPRQTKESSNTRTSGKVYSSEVPDNGKNVQKYAPNVPFGCEKVDSGYSVSNVHHVPDGSDYSAVSNYLSPDKKLSRDEMVGTSDIKLAESRGFNVIQNNEQLHPHNVPRSYSQSDNTAYSRDNRVTSPPNRDYGSNQPQSLPSSYNERSDLGKPPAMKDPYHSAFRHEVQPGKTSTKPTLLTEQSLMKTDFAQKYLGKENQKQQVEDISFMTDDTAAQSFMELEPQNLSTMSHIYGADVPSFYNQMPAYHSTPFNPASMPAYLGTNTSVTPANMSAIPSTGPRGQFRATDSVLSSHVGNQSDGSMHSTLMSPRMATVNVEAPSIITFPDPCCVGISLETTLPLKNPSLRWLQCVIFVKELSLNGRSVDPEVHCPFKLKTKLTVEPDSTENVNLMFLPKSPGAYVAQMEIYCQPFLREENLTAGGYPTTVTLQAIAERPMIQVVTEEEGSINFGILTWGKTKALSLGLRNVGKCTVPLRLAITASKSWHCFMFDKAHTGDLSVISKSNRPPSPALGKSVVTMCLKGYDSSGMSSEDIKIYCKPPDKHGKLGQYPPDEIEARIDVEVDTPIASLPPVASIRLQATIGVLKLHTNTETISLKCPIGKRAEETIKMKNSGNIKMEVQLAIPKFNEVFTVKPEKLFIQPGSYSSVTVCFEPKNEKEPKKYDTIFVMFLVQDGTMYELNLRGEAQHLSPKGFLLSDKSYLAFGGVAIGRAKQQKVTILNNAPQSLKLSVDIRSESRCFQLQSSLGRHEEKIQRRDIIIQAQEKFPIYVLYVPDSVTPSSGKLVIKPYELGTKFSIPLSGYGGVSSIVLEGVTQSGADKYFSNIGPLAVGQNCLCRTVVSNSGQRSVFVRAVAYEDLHCTKTLNPGRMAIDPNEFVLLPGQQKAVMVALSPSNREVAVCSDHKEIVATVAFYHGDEVSRQKYRRGLRRERMSKPLKSIENNAVREINFDVRYVDEERAAVLNEGQGLLDSASDVQHFYSAISKTSLALIGETTSHNPLSLQNSHNPLSLQTSHQQRSRSTSDLKLNTHTGLLPVTKSPVRMEPSRDYNSMSDLSKLMRSPPSDVSRKEDDWEIQPDQLILHIPSRGEKGVSKSFQILNFARRKMNFDLCWPGHCVQVSPKQGVVNPRSTTELRVSPLPSLYENPDLLPWSGTIQINCDNQYKVLRLQIRSEVPISSRSADVSLSSTSLVPLATQVSMPSISVPDTSISDSKEVHLNNTLIKFLNTRVGECCESMLEFTNTSNDPIYWTADSFAPAYVKGVDRTSDVYRVTYAVFQLSDKAGQLKPRETAKVPVVFFPQSSGTFTQYWDIKCRIKSVVAESSVTLQVHLTGEGVEVDKDVRPEKPTNNIQSSVSTDKSKRTSRDRRSTSRPIQLIQTSVHAECPVGQRIAVKIQFQNTSEEPHQIAVVPSQPPFHVKHKEFTVGARKMLKYPVEFKPTQPGSFEGLIVFRTDLGYSISAQLTGHSR